MITREQAVKVARSWIGTPWHPRAKVKGAGADCATFLVGYLQEIGAAPEDIDLPLYKQDWFLHTEDQRYFKGISQYAKFVAEAYCQGVIEAKPGDLILVRHNPTISRFTHGAVVIKFPHIIHAVSPRVGEADATSDPLTAGMHTMIFSPWREDSCLGQ